MIHLLLITASLTIGACVLALLLVQIARVVRHGERFRREDRIRDGMKAQRAWFENDVLNVRVPSQTDPELTYLVVAANGVAFCNCRGFLTHQKCKHATAVANLLKETA